MNNIVEIAYKKAMLAANEKRKTDAERKIDLYENQQLDSVLDLIRADFAKEVERVRPAFLNVVRKIINLKSTVYMQDATRIVTGTEQDAQIYSALEDSAALPVVMKQANRLANLCGVVFLRPVCRRGRMELDLITPDLCDVVLGDSPADIQALSIAQWSQNGRSDEVTYSVWTPEALTKLDYNGAPINEEANPYGVIPFVAVHCALPVNDFWLAGASADLVNSQNNLNLHLTSTLRTLFFQGSAVAWVRGGDTSTLKDHATIGAGTLLCLPENGELGFTAPSAPIGDALATLTFLLEQTCIANGLPASVVSNSAREMSGTALLVENSELQEARRDQIALFAKVEQELFAMFRTVWNVHNPARRMSEGATLRTDFYDPQPAANPLDKLELFAKEHELGLARLSDYLIEKNPDLSRGDAIDQLLEIAAENERLGDLTPQNMIRSQPASLSNMLKL